MTVINYKPHPLGSSLFHQDNLSLRILNKMILELGLADIRKKIK